MKNGTLWKDVNGNPIQAHGGCIIQHGGTYYWYGEHKGVENRPGAYEVDVVGVSCYSSRDLVNWKYEGLVLEADRDNPESYIHTSKILERPKVIFCEKTGRFVLWMHIDSADRCFAGVGIATSDSPTGPFTLLKVCVPNRQDSRDMTVFKDLDGTAYLFHSTDRNKTMGITRLTDDYSDVTDFFVSVLVDQKREAPALFYHNGLYYMITSGCTAWDPNAALYATCPHLLGKWKLIDNPCEGENYRQTFYGQSSYVFEAGGNYYLMLDHWKRERLCESGYSILPIELLPDGNITVRWQEEWLGI